jgi:glucose-6-phosphate isomerase
MTFITTENLLREKSPFMGYEAANHLRKLSYDTIDLSRSGQLTPERLENYYGEACGYKLLYGTERVTDAVIEALEELAKESKALDKMKRMQDGEIMNVVKPYPSENRPVLHTATRDFFEQPRTAPKAKEATFLAKQEIEKLKSFIARLETEKKFDELIVIGIGGSELGPRANFTALQHLLKPGRKVHFISNVDPDDATSILKETNLKRTLVVSISKSGTTLETETNEEIVKNKFKKAGLNPRDHFISVTMPGTPMDNRESYFETFYLWDWVGGRYSTTSMVGGVILAFAFGFDVYWEMLRGAHDMDRAALQSDIKKNLPLLEALLGIWNHNFLNYPTLAVIPYSHALRDYPAHLQQVDMESNGKLIDQQGKFADFETGPVLWGSAGTNAQHSFFQLLHQGTATIPLLMIGFKKNQYGEDLEVHGTTSQEKLLANLFAQSLALALGNKPDNPNKFCPGNRPTHLLIGEQLTPYALGALLAFYEHKVAFQGFIWGINSFDQEGVQLGKGLANQLIEHFSVQRLKTKEQKPDPLGVAYLKHLDSFD